MVAARVPAAASMVRKRWRMTRRKRPLIGRRAFRRRPSPRPGRTRCDGRPAGVRKRLHNMGVRLSDTKPEIRIATMMVTANSWNRRPRMPLMNSTGMNTAASERVIERIVKPISRDALEGSLHAAFAHLHVAHDVFEHHDGVVHHEADGERERHQREIVQRVAQQVHGGEGPDDGEGQGQAGDDGRREVAQEKKDDEHHQDDREQQRELHVVDRFADGFRTVVDDVEIHGGGHLLAETWAAGRGCGPPHPPCWCRAGAAPPG